MYGSKAKPASGSLLTTRKSWNDLTLPLEVLTQLQRLSARLQQARAGKTMPLYGPNLLAGSQQLFCGPPGTGKVLAAQLIARDLDLTLWKIPSASLVERYIGETEKNLDAIFHRARRRGWILYFDEADALFGKRTGVRSHNSRYANQEISYLLQRAEDYRGVVILSTHAKPEFAGRLMRRFEGLVEFS